MIRRIVRVYRTLTIKRLVYLRLILSVMTGVLALATALFLAAGLKGLPKFACPLYADVTVRLEQVDNVTWVNTITWDHGCWGSSYMCEFGIYMHVIIFINAHIWLWIVSEMDPVLRETCEACALSSKSSVQLCRVHGSTKQQKYSVNLETSVVGTFLELKTARKSATILVPFFFVHLLLLVPSFLSVIFATGGLSVFCTKLISNSKLNSDLTCMDTVKWRLKGQSSSVTLSYTTLIKGTVGAWLTLLCLLGQLAAAVAQVDVTVNELCPPAPEARRLSPQLPPADTSGIPLARGDLLLERTTSDASGVGSKGDKSSETAELGHMVAFAPQGLLRTGPHGKSNEEEAMDMSGHLTQ